MMPGRQPAMSGKDFESRLQRVEQQLKAYGDRLARLEQAIVGKGEPGKRTSAPTLDTLDPALRPLPSSAAPHEDESSLPHPDPLSRPSAPASTTPKERAFDLSPAPIERPPTDAKPTDESVLPLVRQVR